MSSPVGSLINGLLEQIGAGSEFYSFFDETKRKRICSVVFETYYESHQDKRVIFDTNRMWSARLHQLVELFGDFKVLCCIRNPAWVMDSFEKIYRKNPFNYSKMFGPGNRQTVYSHDFNNVEFAHDEFDYTLGVKGLHTVRRKVEFKPRRSILPPDLLKKYSEMAFWQDTNGTSASVIAPRENSTTFLT